MDDHNSVSLAMLPPESPAGASCIICRMIGSLIVSVISRGCLCDYVIAATLVKRVELGCPARFNANRVTSIQLGTQTSEPNKHTHTPTHIDPYGVSPRRGLSIDWVTRLLRTYVVKKTPTGTSLPEKCLAEERWP